MAHYPWQRTLRAIWVAQSAAMIGITSCLPFLPLYVRELGITDPSEQRMWGALVGAAPFATSLFITPFWGRLTDRFGNRPMLIRAAIGLIVFNLLSGFASSVYSLLVIRLLQGIFTGIVPASLAMAASIAPRERSGYAISMMQNSAAISAMIGPILGGALSDLLGMRSTFFVVAALSAVALVTVAFFVEEPPRSDTQTRQESREPIFAPLKNPVILQLLVLIALAQTAISFTFPVLALYIEHIGAPAESLGRISGLAVAGMSFCAAFASPRWGRRNDRASLQSTLLFALPGLAAALAIQVIAWNFWIVIAGRSMMGIFSSGLLPTLYTAVQRIAPADKRGSIMGLASSASIVGHLFGPIAGGFLAAQYGFALSFITPAVLALFLMWVVKTRFRAEGEAVCR